MVKGVGESFSVRWTGSFVPKYTEEYSISTESDDGVRLWVGDKQLVSNWTGHGPIVDDPAALIDAYIAHRQMREQQILQAMLDGARTVDDIVRRVYPALPA